MSKKTGKEVKTNNIISDIVYAAGRNGSTVMAGHKYRHKDWTTEAFLLDRRNLNLNILDEDLEFNGIYFLIGHSDGYVDENIYVGQSKIRNNSKDSIMARLREHNTSTTESYRDKWDTVVAVTSMTGDWRADTVCALEHLFFNLIPKSNCLNTVVPPSCTTPDDYDSYTEKIKQIKVYLAMLGVNTFEEKETAESVEDTVNNIVVSDEKFEDLSPEARIPEIVTPKRVVDMMIDSLEKANPDIWNKDTVFLDPACKGGEFLKAIYDKLMKSESMIREFNNEICRSNHILQYQIFGIALSERSKDRTRLSLNGYDRNIIVLSDYIKTVKSINGCSDKYVNGASGLITVEEKLNREFKRVKRDNVTGKERYDMKFGVVIGNPPYQESNNGGGNLDSGKALYQCFMNLGIYISDCYVCMITKNSWYRTRDTGGNIGFDEAKTQLLDKGMLVEVVDFPKYGEVFKGVQCAVSYFLADKNKKDKAYQFTEIIDGEVTQKFTIEASTKDLIRCKELASIATKTLSKYNLSKFTLAKLAFGIDTTGVIDCKAVETGDYNIKLIAKGHNEYIKRNSVTKSGDLINLYKIICTRAVSAWSGSCENVITSVQLLKPGEVCSGTYSVIYTSGDKYSALSAEKYIKTKMVRALLKCSIDARGVISRNTFEYVPLQDFTSSSDIDWTASISDIDKQLYKKYNLSQEEIDYIERTIKPMA